MNIKNKNQLYSRAIILWGCQSQLMVAMEELAELSVEVAKVFNNKNKSFDNLIDELADVTIMVEQIQYMFKLNNKVEERIEFKLNRLDNIIKELK